MPMGGGAGNIITRHAPNTQATEQVQGAKQLDNQFDTDNSNKSEEVDQKENGGDDGIDDDGSYSEAD
jgi:hypothetical protein